MRHAVLPLTLALSALFLMTSASAQMQPTLTLAVHSPTERLDDGDMIMFQGEVSRFCPNAAAVLDAAPVEFTANSPKDLLVQVPSTSFGQQICATEMEAHVGFQGTIHRLGGGPGAHTFDLVAVVQGSDLYGDSRSGPATVVVIFNGTDEGPDAPVAEAPTAATPFPALAAPLALAAVTLCRRRS